MKKKTPFQLQALEKFYEEWNNPTREEMQDVAAVLELTYRQVRDWFTNKRREDNPRQNVVPPDHLIGLCSDGASEGDKLKCGAVSSDHGKQASALVQDLVSPEYILCKVFRKDGPPLGVQFDSLPLKRFQNQQGCNISHSSSHGNQKTNKRKMVPEDVEINNQEDNFMVRPRKHGMGKGLMAAWRAANPTGGDLPTGVNIVHGRLKNKLQMSKVCERNPKYNKQKPISITRKLAMKAKGSKGAAFRRKEMKVIHKVLARVKCGLSLEGVLPCSFLERGLVLIDDEELEQRELLVGHNPPTCSDHCTSNGLYGCSLCKDLLPKFPPSSVQMKPPFASHSWDSSPETVKNLFKALHFIYTYSVPVGACDFTLDEFAQSFQDKESLLLGKLHVALLNRLFLDIETDIGRVSWAPVCVSCKYLALLHSIADRSFVLNFWKNSLNPLTWTEILRQVLIAAGFGSKQESYRRKVSCKEMRLTQKFGLRPKTLKGELFRLVLEQGSKGSKVSDLSKSSKVTELGLANTCDELEILICSTLSSDITLFEKISSSVYRIRFSALRKDEHDYNSDTEDSGSDYENLNECGYSSSESETDSRTCDSCESKCVHLQRSRKNKLIVVDEIDESNPGEIWLLGLMEGEYSDLSIEEKLNALVALIDLLSAGSSFRAEDPARTLVESAFNPPLCGSGAKVKKLSSKQNTVPRPSWVHGRQFEDLQESSLFLPIDSSKINSDKCGITPRKCSTDDGVKFQHPMQSILLGSDRRYNRYWLFLGPCNELDPGHKRIYFESSEDGHWEVIDTEETLHTLLSVLDERGIREAQLLESLEKREAFLCQEMSLTRAYPIGKMFSGPSSLPQLFHVREDSASPLSDVDNHVDVVEVPNEYRCHQGAIILESGKNCEEEYRNRQQDYDSWIWNHFYCNLNAVKHFKKSYFDSLTRCESCNDLYWRDEKHCRICHKTFELDFDLEEKYAIHSATCRVGDTMAVSLHKILSSSLQALKAAVHAIESAMPEHGLVDIWSKSSHKIWVKRLRRTSCLQEVFQVVGDFVAAINEDWLHERNNARDSNAFMDEIVACFPNMPQTSSALALWLTKLDELVSP